MKALQRTVLASAYNCAMLNLVILKVTFHSAHGIGRMLSVYRKYISTVSHLAVDAGSDRTRRTHFRDRIFDFLS